MYQVFLAGNPVPVTLILMDVIVMFPLESPFPFFILSCASMLWIEWISDFLISLFCFFSCSFWWSYNTIVSSFCQYIFKFFFNIFVILRFMCIYFIIYLYFLLFSVNSFLSASRRFFVVCNFPVAILCYLSLSSPLILS